MAQIDSSLYSQIQGPDILGNVQRGMTMGDQIRARNKQKDLDKAYQAGIVTNPDGTTSYDQKKTLSELAKVGGKEYIDAKSKFAEQDMQEQEALKKKQMNDVDVISRLTSGIKDQSTYDSALQEATRFGVDVSTMPKAYDPGLVNRYRNMALTAKEQMDNELKRYEIGAKYAEAAEKRKDANAKQGERKLTQAKQKGLYEMGKLAEQQYISATSDKNDFDPTSPGQFIDNSEWAPAWLKNDKANQAGSAQSAWVESFLRDASGAAIPPSERMAYAKDFFPRPGDSQEVIANKTALRQQKMQNALIASGQEDNGQIVARQTPRKSSLNQSGGMGLNSANAAPMKVLKTKEIEWAD